MWIHKLSKAFFESDRANASGSSSKRSRSVWKRDVVTNLTWRVSSGAMVVLMFIGELSLWLAASGLKNFLATRQYRIN